MQVVDVRLAAVLLLAAAVAGQDAQQPPVPRFRSGVDVVLLDVTVLDKDRRPVRGLSAEDFRVLEEGKPQRVVSFDEVDAPEPDGSLVPWMRDVAPDVRTNAADDRRLIVLVLDDQMISYRYRDDVKKIGRALVDGIGPADQMVVIYTGTNTRSQEFTNDRQKLRQAVDRYVDSLGTGGQASIQAIRRSVDTLVAIPHRRKALIFVSSLAVDFADPESDLGFQLQEALLRAQRANVTIYPINPEGLAVDLASPTPAGPKSIRPGLPTFRDPGRDMANDTARVIATQTGGFPVINTTAFDAQVKQIFRETGSYYLLGFESPHRDGKFRRLEIRVNNPNLTVRTRNGHTAPNPAKDAKREKALPIMKAVASVLPTPDVPIRVTSAAFAAPGTGMATVTIALGIQQPAPTVERLAETVEVLSTAYDMEHRARASFRQTAQMTLRPVDGSRDAKYEILSKLTLKPGRYQLRFAVHSTSLNKSGSVFHDIDVPDFSKSPLSLSGVVIGVHPTLPSAPKDFLSSVTPVTPTTQRIFMRGHRATAFVRVYQREKGPPAAATLITTIVNEEDRAVHSSTQTLTAEQFAGNRAVDHRVDLPLAALVPGSYLLRFAASSGTVTADREVRFVVR